MSSTFDFHAEQDSEMSVRQSTNVRVTTADTELQFGIQPKTIGKGKVFSKVKISTAISTTFKFSRQKVATKLLENSIFLSVANLK